MLLFLASASTQAQVGKCPKIPTTYTWNTKEEFAKDEDLVRKTLRWLCFTPLALDCQQRTLANAFVMEWLAGSPELTIDVETRYLPFVKNHPDLLFSFIHGVALYKMDKPQLKEQTILYQKGFEAVANLALQSKELEHDPELKPLLKAFKKNKMKAFVKKTFDKKL